MAEMRGSGQNAALAQQLIRQGSQTQNISTPLQAAGKIAQSIVGQNMLEEQQKRQRERQQEYADTLQRAAQAGMADPSNQPDMIGPTDMGRQERIAQVLMGNEQTAPKALEMMMQGGQQEPVTQTVTGEWVNQRRNTNMPENAAVNVQMDPRTPGQFTVQKVIEGQEEEEPKGESVTIKIPGKQDPIRGKENEAGNLLMYQGTDAQGNPQWKPAPKNAYTVNVSGSRKETGTAGTAPEKRKYRQLEAQMPVVNRLQNRIEEGLDSGSYVGGVSGSTLKALNSFRNQAQQVYRQFNRDKPKKERDVRLDVDEFRPALGEAANMSNQVQSAILDLAYMTLKAKDPSGRVSDKDIERELDTFGLDTSDPTIMMERVNEKIGDLYANYRQKAEELEMEPQFSFERARVKDRSGPSSGSGAASAKGNEDAQDKSDPLGIR